VKGENLELEDGILPKIVELSDGSFRDGAKILEDLSLQSKNKKITLKLLESLYQTGSIDLAVEKLVGLTLGKKVKEALNVIEGLSKMNADFKSVIEKMANVLHRKLLEFVLKNRIEDISSIQKLLKMLDEAYKNMKGTVIPSLPLEMAVIGFCLEENHAQNTKSKIQSEEKNTEEPIPNKVQPSSAIIKVEPLKSEPLGGDQDTFKKLLDLVNAENKILAGLLRGSHLEISGNNVILKPQSSFHREKLSESKNKEMIKQKLSEAVGKEVAIEIK
jgi:DNA polymerase III gamma/tau subunit